MSDLAELLAQYSQRSGDPSPDEVYSTADVMRRYRDPSWLRRVADAMPSNPDHGVSLLNMLKGGVSSSANWLDGKPQVGPDTLAPLGLAGIGSAPIGAFAANALRRSPDLPAVWRSAHPRTSVDGRSAGEGIANAAVRSPDGEMFVAPTHYMALQAAEAKRGPAFVSNADDGFVTTTGRYLDRYEAMAMARAADDPAKRSRRDFMDSTDLPHVGPFPFNKYPINADQANGSLPGTVVNAVEQSGSLGRLEPRPMSDRALHDIGQANFTTPYRVDPMQEVPRNSLHGSHHRPERVEPLANAIRENRWIEPLVVDRDGNVIEGQHRLRALERLGVENVPVHRLRELGTPEQVAALQSAAKATGIHREQAAAITRQILEIVDREGVQALGEYAPPRGFERGWNAAIAALNPEKQSVRLPAVTGLPLPSQDTNPASLLATLLSQYDNPPPEVP